MAHKITLGARPKNFTHAVTFALPEGGEGVIHMVFKYRTRSEFGALVDSLAAQAGVAPPKSGSEEDVQFSLQAILQAGSDQNAAYILQIADGWDLPDHPFELRAVQQLCDELPGAALAIMGQYRAAIVEGRLGN